MPAPGDQRDPGGEYTSRRREPPHPPARIRDGRGRDEGAAPARVAARYLEVSVSVPRRRVRRARASAGAPRRPDAGAVGTSPTGPLPARPPADRAVWEGTAAAGGRAGALPTRARSNAGRSLQSLGPERQEDLGPTPHVVDLNGIDVSSASRHRAAERERVDLLALVVRTGSRGEIGRRIGGHVLAIEDVRRDGVGDRQE